jgi:hypothetical protein
MNNENSNELNTVFCQLCQKSDQKYLLKYGGINFSCGHIVCWFCSTMHCEICRQYQIEKCYANGRIPDTWPIKQEGCVICNSKDTLPCGELYSDCSNIIPPH